MWDKFEGTLSCGIHWIWQTPSKPHPNGWRREEVRYFSLLRMGDYDVSIPRNLPKGTLVDNLCVYNFGVPWLAWEGIQPLTQ